MSNTDFSGSIHHYNPDKDFQTKHVLLNLDFDIKNKSFWGSCTLTLQSYGSGVSQITLNACEMQIQSCSIGGIEVEFDSSDDKLHVFAEDLISLNLGQVFDLIINYSVQNPTRGIYFVGPNEYYPDKPVQVFTQGESTGSRYWMPLLDAPNQIATSEVIIKTASNFRVLSNGLLVGESIENDCKTTHWWQDIPHPKYLITLVIAELAEVKSNWNEIEVNYYTHPKFKNRLALTAAKTPKMIEFYSNFFGVRFPWKKYYQAWLQDFVSGGMENTSMTINTNRALSDERVALDYRWGEILVAHELAHQWFGDLIVINHWSELWIKEGAATYSEHLWTEHEYGSEEGDYYHFQDVMDYLSENPRVTATNYYREEDDLYDGHSYGKAGLVYHYIRCLIGKDLLFTAFLKELLTTHAHQNVNFNDLIRACEITTGKNITPILDQFILGSGHPKLSVSYSWDETNKLIKLNVKQTQFNKDDVKNTLFKLPKVKLGIGQSDKNGSGTLAFKSYELITLDIVEAEQNFYIHRELKPSWISLDPSGDVPKSIELEYSNSELENMLQFDPKLFSRITAAQTLGKKSTLANLKILEEALNLEKFWGVRLQIVKAIAKINLDQTLPVLVQAINDENSRVRQEVVISLGTLANSQAWEKLYEIATGNDPSYFVESSALASLGRITQKIKGGYTAKALELFQKVLNTKVDSWNEIIRRGVISGLMQLNDNPTALEIILANTKLGTSQYLRVAAIAALGKVSIAQEKNLLPEVIQALQLAARESDMDVESAVIAAGGSVPSSAIIPILESIINKTVHRRSRRPAEEAIQAVQKNLGLDKSFSLINEKLAKLEKENQSLKSRIEEIEKVKSLDKIEVKI